MDREQIPASPPTTPETGDDNAPNYYAISEERKELRHAVNELGEKNGIFDKHYRKPLEDLQAQAAEFKIADYGGLTGAKAELRRQKAEYERQVELDRAHIDYDAIFRSAPEIAGVEQLVKKIAYLKDFRMRRMFEILSTNTSLSTKKRNEGVLQTIKEEIRAIEATLDQADPLVLRQAELIGYRENLFQSGHICVTPEVEKYLDAMGDRMLTGKPMFLHGPTGTGKTSLARFAARHFTGQDPQMVYCHPQTKESNVWGRTAIKSTKDGKSFFTVLDFGPLAKAIKEGTVIIFDEFTALPKEQMVFIKAIFNLKPGDTVNVVGDGLIEVAPGFQPIFTANLKSEKNPERQDLPPEITREFEQNNLEILYTSPEEAYDIMIARLLNRDGSLDMSFYDLNTTLPNLCKVMAEIQESYTNETDKDVARRAGAMDASGKVYSLKKFVMTQGSVEAILSAWLIEQQASNNNRCFAEFLDQRFKTALTFKEYSKEDRILVAKILASKGFLLTVTAKDLDLPEDIFKLNTIKSMRGDDAVDELRKESGNVRHLTLKEVAELDPFNKRADRMRSRAENLLGAEEDENDPFLTGIDRELGKIFGKEKKGRSSEVSTDYVHPDGHKETIILNLEAKLQEFISLYKKTNLDLPPDFEDTIRDIWERHQDEIEQAIQENGFDELLLIPPTPNLPELSEQMKVENGYFTGSNFDAGGGFAGAVSQNQDLPRLILVHKAQELKDRPELAKTLNTKGSDVNPDQALTLEDYLIFQRHYFETTGKHLDEIGYTWLATKSGTRLVRSYWYPGHRRLSVLADDLEDRLDGLGVRPSRCFN